uniref:Uncharacterized protein n=1 Tax=Candidatus Berkiella cookevillensis TaxID=437022 RepID=A0A0Q9Y9U4_9GAMM
MTHILILPLSLLVKTNPMATVAAFRGLGIGLHSMIWNWRKTIQCIEKYKSGLLHNDQFIAQLKVIYPKLSLVAEPAIWEALTCPPFSGHRTTQLIRLFLHYQVFDSPALSANGYDYRTLRCNQK